MFPPEMKTLRRLEIARDAGFEGVEVNLEPWEEYSLAAGDDELAALRRAIEARGLRVSAVYDREQWHFPMSSRNPATRERCRDIITGLVRAATILGSDTVLVMPGGTDNSVLAPQPEIVPYEIAYRNSQAVLRELAATACEQNGVNLGAENCPSKFLYSPLEFCRFLDEINSPWVGAYFDVGNVIPYGFPEHWIPLLDQRIKRVHFKDIRLSAGGGACATPLLAGDVNWPAVRESLRGVGYDSWITAEVIPHYRHHPERLIYETSASMDAILGLP
jgi:hexulose-6-phosphate isomerase